LKQGKAVIGGYHPFTIQLNYASGEARQDLILGVDAGFKVKYRKPLLIEYGNWMKRTMEEIAGRSDFQIQEMEEVKKAYLGM